MTTATVQELRIPGNFFDFTVISVISLSADPGRRKGERVREEDVLHCYYFGRNFDAFPSCRALLLERGGGADSELGNNHPGSVY